MYIRNVKTVLLQYNFKNLEDLYLKMSVRRVLNPRSNFQQDYQPFSNNCSSQLLIHIIRSSPPYLEEVCLNLKEVSQ
jgi:hypothetical protein